MAFLAAFVANAHTGCCRRRYVRRYRDAPQRQCRGHSGHRLCGFRSGVSRRRCHHEGWRKRLGPQYGRDLVVFGSGWRMCRRRSRKGGLHLRHGLFYRARNSEACTAYRPIPALAETLDGDLRGKFSIAFSISSAAVRSQVHGLTQRFRGLHACIVIGCWRNAGLERRRHLGSYLSEI
jgi:hypothetical protein